MTVLFAKLAKKQHGKSILKQLHSDENRKIMHVHLRFLIRLDLPIGCHHCSGDPDLSNSPELKSFLLNMCIEAPESITKCLFQLCRRKCRHNPSFGKRVERILCLIFEFVNILCHLPKRLCGRAALVSGFRFAFFPRIWDCTFE